MHYVVKLEIDRPESTERLDERCDVFLTPDGEQGWAILEAEDEDSVRWELEGHKVEEVQPVLPVKEYAAIREARENIEEVKARFVDDPSGALEEARRQVGFALEKRGYPSPERADGASRHRQVILREYHRTQTSESASVEEKREAFNALSDLLDRSART